MRHCTNKTNQFFAKFRYNNRKFNWVQVCTSSFLQRVVCASPSSARRFSQDKTDKKPKRKASFSVNNSHCRLLWSAHESRRWLPRGLTAVGLRKEDIETFLDMHCECEAIQWIPFLMFETLNSCWRKLVCAKIMPNVGKNLSWRALLPNFKKNQKRKLVSSQIRLVHFPHLRGQLWGVTTSQIHSFLSMFWHIKLPRWGTIAYR